MSRETRDIMEKLKYMSECIDKKCDKLTQLPPNDESLREQLFKLCDNIKKNCEEFQKVLGTGKPDPKYLIISLNLLEVAGEQNCNNLKDDVIKNLQILLEKISKNYLEDMRDPVLYGLYKLFYPEFTTNAHFLNEQDINSSSIIGSKEGTCNANAVIASEVVVKDPKKSSDQQISQPNGESSKEVNTVVNNHLEEHSKNDDVQPTGSINTNTSEVEVRNLSQYRHCHENTTEEETVVENTTTTNKNIPTSLDELPKIDTTNDSSKSNQENSNKEPETEIKTSESVSPIKNPKQDIPESENDNTKNLNITSEKHGLNKELEKSSDIENKDKQDETTNCQKSEESETGTNENLNDKSDSTILADDKIGNKPANEDVTSDNREITDSTTEENVVSNNKFVGSLDVERPDDNTESTKCNPESEIIENAEIVCTLDTASECEKIITHEQGVTVDGQGSVLDKSVSDIFPNSDVDSDKHEDIRNNETTSYSETVSCLNHQPSTSQNGMDHPDCLLGSQTSEGTILNEETVSCLNHQPSTSQNGDHPDCLLGSQTSEGTILNEDNEEDRDRFLAELGLSKTSNHDKILMMRDELMEMFAEVHCAEDSEGVMREISTNHADHDSSSNSSVDGDKYTEDAATAALKDLDDDTSLMDWLSESEPDFSVDSDVSDCSLIANNRNKIMIKKFVPKKFSVKLERMNLEELKKKFDSAISQTAVIVEDSDGDSESDNIDTRRKSVDKDAEINRLCQLPVIGKKRKLSRENTSGRKIKRKRRIVELSGSETAGSSDYSSVSDNDFDKNRDTLNTVEDDHPTVEDPNTLLAEIVCQTIHDSDSESTDISSSDEKDKKHKVEKKNESRKSPRKTDKINRRESWRDDPLLRGNLNVPSQSDKKDRKPNNKRLKGSSSESEDRPYKRVKNITRSKYLDPDWSGSSDDFEGTSKSSNKESIVSDSDDDSDTESNKESDKDSDIEYIGTIKAPCNGDEPDRKNRRRKILPVLSSRDLTESTQRAAEEEKDRVMKLEEQRLLKGTQESISEDDGIVLDVSNDGSKIVIDCNLSKKLFAHQIDGVKFMWEASYLSIDNLETFQGSGCILAHNMGLGKTFQVVTLVHTLFSHAVTKTKHVLVVCPLSTVSGWKKEFKNALNTAAHMKDIKIVAIESKHESKLKCYLVQQWKRSNGVLIIGYEAFCCLTKKRASGDAEKMREALMNPGPDLVICDEGHLLKNGKSLRTKALMEIKTKRRIALTGTPLQNNLNEYYHMVQFVKPNLLGTKNEFNRQFINPIMNGQYEDSEEQDITLMKKRTHVLHRILKNTVQRYEATELHKYLENMQDYALFIQLHPIQEKLYRKYIELVNKQRNPTKTIKSFFVDYQILKYICSHPQLLQTMETQSKGDAKKIQEKEVISEEPEVQEVEGIPQDWWKEDCSEEIQKNIQFGSKLQVMMAIIEEAEKNKEKVLIFTSSLVELSSIEYFLKVTGTPSCPVWKSKRDYFRMDGTVPPAIRTDMCDLFNDRTNETLRVFLMSHKVGGLGLNLVAANRVILLGANFNPSHDSQSIFRAYRFGQDKPVYIYRLLSMGTMEEKIYHRCVSKLAIASRVVDKHQIARHYKNLDLESVYNIDINLDLPRPTPAKPDDDLLSSILLRFESIHKYHHHQKLLENRPDEDLNEEEQKTAWEEFEDFRNREKNSADASTVPSIPQIVEQERRSLKIYEGIAKAYSRLLLTQPGSSKSSDVENMVQGSSTQNMPPNQPMGIPKPVYRTIPMMLSNGTKGPSTVIPMQLNKGTNNSQSSMNGGATTKSKADNGIKTKSSPIGPNPLYLRKFQRINEKMKARMLKANWRTSSSDDFQKTIDSNAPIIDISDDRNAEEIKKSVIEEQLEKLRANNLTIISRKNSKEKDAPDVIEIT